MNFEFFMSGHSKWHNIQARKGKQDKARSNMFTKAARAITVAAQTGGGDESMNFSLRLAIEKAKAVNMPKDNIDRAIKRGTGELKDGSVIEEIVYEGFGPGGVALIIEAVTDNRTRTVSDLKHILSKHGGALGGPGSVQWQFEHKAVIRFTAEKKSAIADWDAFELELIDSGAEDIRVSEEGMEIVCAVPAFQKVLSIIQKRAIEPDDSGLEWIPKEKMGVDTETAAKLDTLYEVLGEMDDIKDVYSNVA